MNANDNGRMIHETRLKMKTFNNIYPKVYSYKNLESAFKKARKGKTKKDYVINFEKDLKNNLIALQEELKNQTYKPAPLKKFLIRDPKTRIIRKSTFKDRIIHHALINILDPIYEREFIHDCCANRKNKGTKEAIRRFDIFKRRVTKNLKSKKAYILKADIKLFFESIDHEILLKKINKKIKDRRTINLIQSIIKNCHNKEKGMPLGNMTSQFFANLYLSDLDYFIKHSLKVKHYIRYVDDFVILHENKERLEAYSLKIKAFLKELKLELHPDKSKIFKLVRGVDFLGFRIFFYHRMLRRRNLRNFKKRLNLQITSFNKGTLSQEKIIQSIEGWLAYASQGNTHNLRKKLITQLETHINQKSLNKQLSRSKQWEESKHN